MVNSYELDANSELLSQNKWLPSARSKLCLAGNLTGKYNEPCDNCDPIVFHSFIPSFINLIIYCIRKLGFKIETNFLVFQLRLATGEVGSILFWQCFYFYNLISSNLYHSTKQDLNLDPSRISGFEDCKATALTTQPPWLDIWRMLNHPL